MRGLVSEFISLNFMNRNKAKSFFLEFRLYFAIGVSLLFISVFYNKWVITEGIFAHIEATSSRDIDFQAYYTTDANKRYIARYSTKQQMLSSEKQTEIFLPVSEIRRFRLDVGNTPGKLVVSKVRLEGAKSITLDLSKFKPHNIENYKVQTKGAVIDSMTSDPYLVYSDPVNLKAGVRRVDWWKLFILAVGPFYLFNVITDWCLLQSPRNENKLPNLINIEALRVYFTLCVVIRHMCGAFGWWGAGGVISVHFFFILSGYLLALTFKPERSLIGIATNRYIRFVPLIVLGGMLNCGEWNSFSGAFMLQSSGLYPRIPNGPSWYIAVLFFCTLFYVALMKLLTPKKLMFIAALIALIGAHLVSHTQGNVVELYAGLVSRGTLRGVTCMAIGILLFCFCRRDNEEQIHTGQRVVYTIAECALLVYITVAMYDKHWFSSIWVTQPIYLTALLYLFIVKRGYISALVEKRFFAKLSQYCLAVYLTHCCLSSLIKKLLASDYAGWVQEHSSLVVCLAVLASCLLGVVAHYLVEKPGARYFTRFLNWMKPVGRKMC